MYRCIENHHIIDKKRLMKMQRFFFINCARGGIIDEEAVRDLTKSGHLAGAGFDVYSVEPILKTNLGSFVAGLARIPLPL